MSIPHIYLQKARELRNQLLATSAPDVLLHGNLHHDNILQDGKSWVVIDPKGVIGEPAYEIAAYIRNPMPELLKTQNASAIMQGRIAIFSDLLNVPKARIVNWCFVQAVLAWVWSIEDNCDTSYFEQLTQICDTMIVK